MTELLDRMRGLSAAEEFFDLLGVPYDPAVLRVARLHILRRMGQYLSQESLSSMTDDAAKESCRAMLARAYADFEASSPLKERVFKVLKDAVRSHGVGFVSLSDITDTDEAA